jgi:hypothetical protein
VRSADAAVVATFWRRDGSPSSSGTPTDWLRDLPGRLVVEVCASAVRRSPRSGSTAGNDIPDTSMVGSTRLRDWRVSSDWLRQDPSPTALLFAWTPSPRLTCSTCARRSGASGAADRIRVDLRTG